MDVTEECFPLIAEIKAEPERKYLPSLTFALCQCSLNQQKSMNAGLRNKMSKKLKKRALYNYIDAF